MIRALDRNRNGTTAVEMAMVLPIILIVFWGFWEWSRVEMIRQAAATAAYEGARRGTIPGTTTAQMTAKAQERLAPYSVKNPAITSTLNANSSRVEITIPMDQNLWSSGRFFAGTNLQSIFELDIED